ncbi:MAG: hypothetical protein ACT4OU_10450 [Hyphomicrobium sp.]
MVEMTYLLLQTFLLLLAAYFAGAFAACLTKRWISAGAEPRLAAAPASMPMSMAPPAPIAAPPMSAAAAAAAAAARLAQGRGGVDAQAPRPVTVQRPAPRPRVEVRPRSIELVQPKIDLLPRPAPRPVPSVADTYRFERALIGPDPNEGMPRRPIIEIRPAVHDWVTGPPGPWPPPPKPEPIPEPVPEPEAEPEAVAAKSPIKPRDEKAIAAQAAEASEIRARSGVSAAAANAAAAASAALAAAKAAAASISGPKAAKSDDPGTPKPAPAKLSDRLAEAAPTEPQAPSSNLIADGDDLQRVRAIDAATEQALKREGILRLETIARWTAEDVELYDDELKLQGRIDKEQWIEQAQILAKGGETYYSRNRAAAAKAAAAAALPQKAPAAAPDPAPTDSAGEASDAEEDEPAEDVDIAPSAPAKSEPPPTPPPAKEGKSVGDIAAAAAAAIAAASASVTRGIRPIEPISPLSKVNPNVVIPARLSDALKENNDKGAGAAPIQPSPRPAPGADEQGGDDLKRIRGVGVLIEKRLKALRVTTYEAIANWTSDDIDRVSNQLDFRGRIEREGWVEQARILSSGGQTEFSRRVDRGEVESSKDG